MRSTAMRVLLVKQRIYKCRARRTCALAAVLGGALVPLFCAGKRSKKIEKAYKSVRTCEQKGRRVKRWNT